MLFQTFDFLLFAVPVLVGFWALGERPLARVLFLLLASYFFYAAGPQTEPPPAPAYFAGLLVFSTVLDFVSGREIHRQAEASKSDNPRIARPAQRLRNVWLAASLIGNLGLLAYFKYVNFFAQAFADIGRALGYEVVPFHLDLVLPLGISFYTFQSLSYTLDIWKGRLEPEPSFLRFALFVSFFPQLVAGPIVRASEFLPQLRAGPRFSREALETGAFRFCKGLVKKVVLGDWIAIQLTDRIFDAPGMYTAPELLVALYAYTLQIYADFSGYSDMAIGIGLMLGFRLPENFARPYQSRDIAEYWRRWHMTLSSWLRDYLFFQLLARYGAKAGYVGLWLTMFLVGMWHGASWNFVIYANIHAGAMLVNRWNKTRKRKGSLIGRAGRLAPLVLATAVALLAIGHYVLRLESGLVVVFSVLGTLAITLACAVPVPTKKTGPQLGALHIALTFHLVVLSRIFFRAPDLATARAFCSGLLTWDLAHLIRPGLATPWVWAALVLGLAYHFTPQSWVDDHLCRAFRRIPGVLLGLGFVALCFGLMKLLDGSPRAFIYFMF